VEKDGPIGERAYLLEVVRDTPYRHAERGVTTDASLMSLFLSRIGLGAIDADRVQRDFENEDH
jgi:hypothetical protein